MNRTLTNFYRTFAFSAGLTTFSATHALADFQSSLQSLVTGALSGIFPIFVMYEVGKAGLSLARKAPDAKERVEAAALGTVAVLGINGVWIFLRGHIK